MKRSEKIVIAIPTVILTIVVGFHVMFGIPLGIDSPVLEFPILESDRVVRLSAFYTPDWGEPGVFHNGIDLVISDNVTIVAPHRGTVIMVSEHVNPYAGNTLFSIDIAINTAWVVELVIEPGFLDPHNNSRQSSLISARIGQRVLPGDHLATLMFSSNYPHLHYSMRFFGCDVCPYNYSSPSARATFDVISQTSGSRILYPHPSPTPLSCPLLAGTFVFTTFYVFAAAVVVRRSRR